MPTPAIAYFLRTEVDCLILALQAVDVGDDVPEIVLLQNNVGHGRVGALHPDGKRHLGHTGCVRHLLESGRLRQGRD